MGAGFDLDGFVRGLDDDQPVHRTQVVRLGSTACRLEAISVAGEPDCPNEDACAISVVAGSLFVGVFDGITSLVPIPELWNRGLTGARFAARLLADELPRLADPRSARATLLALNDALDRAIRAFATADLSNPNARPSSSATILRLDPTSATLEVASVLDSWCAVYFDDGTSRLLTEDQNRRFDEPLHALIVRLAGERGITPRQARDLPEVKEALVASRVEKTNLPDESGCGTINGDSIVERYVQSTPLPLVGVEAMLLGTDGLFPLGWSPERSDDRRRARDLIAGGGLHSLIEAKQASEDADPDWRVPRFKHSDDATGVYLRLL